MKQENEKFRNRLAEWQEEVSFLRKQESRLLCACSLVLLGNRKL